MVLRVGDLGQTVRVPLSTCALDKGVNLTLSVALRHFIPGEKGRATFLATPEKAEQTLFIITLVGTIDNLDPVARFTTYPHSFVHVIARHALFACRSNPQVS